MMKGHKDHSSQLFLMELMISIFFFAIVVAICTQVFADARQLSTESAELTAAVNACTNVAEAFDSWDEENDDFTKYFPDGEWIGNATWQYVYDENYVVQMVISEEGSLQVASIQAFETSAPSEVIYELIVKRIP